MSSAIARASLILALAASPLAAQSQVDIPYQRFVLPNGLTVLVHEDHKAPIVAVNVWYHVGSKNERPGRTGFAHLFEHLMFNGSEHYDKEFMGPLERAGATELNGTTNEDRTNYFTDVPTSALDLTLCLESDRMGHLVGAISQAKLDEQRGVVQNEKRQGENEPYGKVWDFLTPKLYPSNHPYSWTTIGSMEDLNAAKLDDVKDWFQTYYGPANAVLVIAGDVDLKTAKEKVEHYFGDIPSGPPVARQGAWIAKRTGSQRGTMQDRVPQTRIYKVWNVPQWGSADGDYLSLAASVLSTGKSSRLYKRLVYDEQIASDVDASLEQREIGGLFTIEAGVASGHRPGQGRAGDRRGAGPLPRRRAHAGRAPAGQDPDAGRVHPRRRAHRRLRRQVRRAGQGRGVRRPAGLLQGADAADRRRHGRADPRSRARGGSPTACYTLDGRARSPTTPSAATGADRSKLPEPGDAAQGRVPRARARDAVERPQGRAGRAARDPRSCSSTCCSTPASRPTSSPSRARRAWRWRCSTRAPRPGRALQISDRLAELGAIARRGLTARRLERVARRAARASSTLRSSSTPTSSCTRPSGSPTSSASRSSGWRRSSGRRPTRSAWRSGCFPAWSSAKGTPTPTPGAARAPRRRPGRSPATTW